MRRLLMLIASGLMVALGCQQTLADSTNLHKISWKGAKWEYLVEYPRDVQHVDPERFEEILDTAGQHGWELVEVSHESHFYAFYFKRELLPEGVAQHRKNLKAYKAFRATHSAQQMQQILGARQERMEYIKEYQDAIKEVEQQLKEENKLTRELNKNLKEELKLKKKEMKSN